MTSTDVIKLIIAICTPLLSAAALALAAQASVYLHKRFTQPQIMTVAHAASIAVRATEQVAAGGALSSEAKYDIAAKYLSALAGKAGVQLGPDEIKPLIENAVQALNRDTALMLAPSPPADPPARAAPPAQHAPVSVAVR